MTESPVNIPVYDGSLASVRSSSSSVDRLRQITGLSRRKAELQPKWKNGELESKYRCSSCNNYLRFPIQFEVCGHHVCSSCLPDIMRIASRCPTCQQPIAKDKIVNDKDLEKEIQNLEVYCTNKEKGCDWFGILRNFPVHIETCGFILIDCLNECGAKFERRFLNKHQNEDCTKRTITCEFCKTSILFENEISHLNICPEFKIPCPNQCSTQEFSRQQIQNHLDNECSKQEISCPFHDCGCEYRANRTIITQHIKDSSGIHLNMAGKTISIQKQLLTLYEERSNEQKKWIELLARKINALEKTYGSQFIWKIDHYQERLQDARTNIKSTLFSPQFLTSRYGYRLALSICLWGDGKLKGKYVSLFICIHRGEYDSLLVWPFSHRVTFTLLDQCEDVNNCRHITCTIKPNICQENKPFLGRPITERNASFGCPKFIDMDTMTKFNYVKDDTIFIKVEVDNEEMIFI
ncbi:unnamed protein product [Rotaria sordida]|uniref:Uncharacterized protein n=1 Tax=Rotaria sordida TaxID=392033 RepID=A0A814HKH8_9BILA|nr:unnamed protein product [Rotaria sordida]CAF1535829.1 unnamed protein product [Rotaria sordida]